MRPKAMRHECPVATSHPWVSGSGRPTCAPGWTTTRPSQDAADCSGRDDVIPMMRALTCATDASKRMMAQIMALQAAEISHRPPTPKVPRKARA